MDILRAEPRDPELKGIDKGPTSFATMRDSRQAAALLQINSNPPHKPLHNPTLKGWLDNVLIPAMVLRCLARSDVEADNGVVSITERIQ